MTTSTKSSHLFIFITKAQVVRFIESSIDFSILSMNLIVLTAFKSSYFYRHTRMSFTFSSNSTQTSKLKHQKQHRKSYFTMNNLFEMLIEKSSKRNMNIIQKKLIFSFFFEFRQIRIKSLRQRDFKDTIMIAKKQFKKNLNAIRKRMRFSFFSMFDQIKIISYFKFVDQSFKSFKFNAFINCFCSTFRIYFSVNRTAETSQYQQIAIDETSNQRKFKSFEMQLLCTSQQKYIVATNVYHINKNIRVETLLTNAKEYNSIKSLIKLFKSLKSFRKLKFSIFSNKLNSTSRVCFSINQVAEISQYQHIAIDKIRLLKSLKFIVIINSFNSTLRFSLSVNYDSLMSSRIDFFRVLINQQMIYVSITRFSYRFSY